jgi:hemoglobin
MRGRKNTAFLLLTLAVTLGFGCASTPEKKKKEDFFTSGSPDADRRAEKASPVKKEDKKKAEDLKDDGKKKTATGQELEKQVTLYDRLGQTEGIQRIVNDFIQRVLEDPRVNWTRRGVKKKTWFRTTAAPEWSATPENINRLKLHFVQFISLATGGPPKYDGKPVKPTHLPMQISKSEFDATIGDLKATLDKLNIPSDVQKDLLAIFESTRQQIVPERN